jgi:hypothetical protein
LRRQNEEKRVGGPRKFGPKKRFSR